MKNIKIKKGFTLIELLLAILLVSLFAYFVFATPTPVTAAKEEVNVTNLPSYLQRNLPGNGELVCIKSNERCSDCYYFTPSGIRDYSLPLSLKINAEYTLDKNNNPQKIDLGRYKDKKVCLRLRHYKNGSISQIILNVNNKFLFIPSYFGDGMLFDSLNEAGDWWVRESVNALQNRSEWY